MEMENALALLVPHFTPKNHANACTWEAKYKQMNNKTQHVTECIYDRK